MTTVPPDITNAIEKDLQEFRSAPRPDDFLRAYSSIAGGDFVHVRVFTAVAALSLQDEILATTEFEYCPLYGMPSYDPHQPGVRSSSPEPEYVRFTGMREGIEPFVFPRSFPAVFSPYAELSEEFRLFHNLYDNRKDRKLMKLLEAGEQEVVAEYTDTSIGVRVREVRDYLCARQMILVQFFHFTRYFHFMQKEDFDPFDEVKRAEDLTFRHWGGRHRTQRSKVFSVLEGKRLIRPFATKGTGKANRAPKRVDFIVDVDKEGTPIAASRHPLTEAASRDKHGSYLGSLMPVAFRPEVLEKYLRKPGTYTVVESRVSCGTLWGLTIDNLSPNRVVVMLKDLWGLPYTEQQYWMAYNIPCRACLSDPFYQRNFEGDWDVRSKNPIHVFWDAYRGLLKAQDNERRVLRPLSESDEHTHAKIRIPVDNDPLQFEDLMDALSKVLGQSLGESALMAYLPSPARDQWKAPTSKGAGKLGTIQLLKYLLETTSVENHDEIWGPIDRVQKLRQGGTHPKGAKWQKHAKEMGLTRDNLSSKAEQLLREAAQALCRLKEFVERPPSEQAHSLGQGPDVGDLSSVEGAPSQPPIA